MKRSCEVSPDRCVWQEPLMVEKVLRGEEEVLTGQTGWGRTVQGDRQTQRYDQVSRVRLGQSGCGGPRGDRAGAVGSSLTSEGAGDRIHLF